MRSDWKQRGCGGGKGTAESKLPKVATDKWLRVTLVCAAVRSVERRIRKTMLLRSLPKHAFVAFVAHPRRTDHDRGAMWSCDAERRTQVYKSMTP